MGATIEFEPGKEHVTLHEVLQRREDRTRGKLITSINADLPEDLRYAQVARSPADRPQVCAAVCAGESGTSLAIGGYGAYPEIRTGLSSADQAREWAQKTYSDAGDQWASAEYRAAVAGTLAARLVREVISK